MAGLYEWYIPVSQAAEMIGCHWRGIYELMDKGFLAWVLVPPNKVRISLDSVHRYLDQGRFAVQ